MCKEKAKVKQRKWVCRERERERVERNLIKLMSIAMKRGIERIIMERESTVYYRAERA